MLAMKYYVSKGYAVIGAGAIVGNLSQEVGNDLPTGHVIESRTDHGSQGLAQWRLDRLDKFYQYCKDGNLSPWTLETQLGYVIWELENISTLRWINEQLMNPGDRSISNLTANFSAFYERPSKKYENLDNRIKQAGICAATFLMEQQTVVVTEQGTPPIVAGGGLIGTGAAVATGFFSGPEAALVVAFVSFIILIAVAAYVQRRKETAPAASIELPERPLGPLQELKDAVEALRADRQRVEAAMAVIELSRSEADKLLAELKEEK